jgi:hypothetical protein
VEAINIFIRINGVEDLLFIDMLRHRQLDKYAVNLRVFIVLIDKLEKIGLGYFSRLAVLDRVKTDFMCCFLLGCDITDRRRVLAYEDCNQPGNNPVSSSLFCAATSVPLMILAAINDLRL